MLSWSSVLSRVFQSIAFRCRPEGRPASFHELGSGPDGKPPETLSAPRSVSAKDLAVTPEGDPATLLRFIYLVDVLSS